MILETIRTLKDQLENGTYGLAAKLATVPRDGSDPLPTTPTIVDETRSLPVALGRPPATLPALAISLDAVTDLDPRSTQKTRDASVSVVFRYWVLNAEAEKGTRDAYYVMRALERSLDSLPLPITRNQVDVYSCTERQYGGTMQTVDDAVVMLGLRAVFQVRENLP